jgi:hypothetical protein
MLYFTLKISAAARNRKPTSTLLVLKSLAGREGRVWVRIIDLLKEKIFLIGDVQVDLFDLLLANGNLFTLIESKKSSYKSLDPDL